MIVKKQISQGAYAKIGEDIKDGDILQIVNEGSEVEGDFGPRFVAKVKLVSGEVKALSFNQTSMNYLIDAYGEDTAKWVGEDIKATLVNQVIQGKMKKVAYFADPLFDVEMAMSE